MAKFYPESLDYRLKRLFLGKPLVSEQLSGERLNRPIALGVLAPDCISSSAYGTEEILTQMTPYIGLAAFALVVPIMFVIIGVLFFVTTSYLDVIKYYTTAGGSLRGGARQLRAEDRPDRGRSASDRLHRHRRRAVLGRYRRPDDGLPGADHAFPIVRTPRCS